MLVLGFVIGTMGHIIKSKTLVIAGITLVFAATVLLPVVLNISN